MIFLSLHYGGPHASPAKRVVWGEGGTTEWSGCPPSGGRSGVEFVPTRRRRRRLKRTSAVAPVLTGVWGRSATNKHVPGIYRRIACPCYRKFLILAVTRNPFLSEIIYESIENTGQRQKKFLIKI